MSAPRTPTTELRADTDRVDLVLRVTLSPKVALEVEAMLEKIAERIGATVGRQELGYGGTRILRRVKVR